MKIDKKQWLEILASWILLGILLAGAISARLNNIFWDTSGNMEEETRHTMSIIDNIMFRDLYRSIQGLLHPGLDYLTRKIFWYPLLGADERSVRLVSLFYGIAAIYLNYLIIVTLLRKNKKTTFLLPIIAFVGSIWIATASVHVYASVFGRLYSMITFTSALFTYAYFCRAGYGRFFHITSTLLMNTHFFALPIIGTVYAYEAWKQKCLRPIFIFSALVALTFLINYKPLEWLIYFHPSPGTRSIMEAAGVALILFHRFFTEDIGFGNIGALVFLLLILVDIYCNRKFRIEYFVVGPLLLLFLLYLSKKSDYPVSPNYLLVFWGFIPILFVTLITSTATTLRRIPLSNVAILFLLSIITVTTGGTSLAQTFGNLSKIKMPSRNFTRYYQGYTWAKQIADGRPILILADTCYTLEAPNYYMRHTHPVHRGALLIEDTFGCFYPRERVAKNIQKFMQDNPNLIVLLDGRYKNCGVIQAENEEWNKGNNQKRNLLEPRFDADVLCFQLMDKPKSYAEILAKLNASGFKHNLP